MEAAGDQRGAQWVGVGAVMEHSDVGKGVRKPLSFPGQPGKNLALVIIFLGGRALGAVPTGFQGEN